MESMTPPAHFTPIQAQLLWLTVRQDPVAYVRELTHIGTDEDREAVAVFLAAQAQPELPVIAPSDGVMADLREAHTNNSLYPYVTGVIEAIVSAGVSGTDADKLAEIRGLLVAADEVLAEWLSPPSISR